MQELPVEAIVNRDRLDVEVTGPHPANRLLIYTGTAVLKELVVSEGNTAQAVVKIVLGNKSIADPYVGDNFDGTEMDKLRVAPHVTLAGIFDLGDSSEVHWTVDETNVKDFYPTALSPRYIAVEASVSARGEFTGILRLSYHVDVLAVERESRGFRDFASAREIAEAAGIVKKPPPPA
jgi:hypothetical protein